MAERPKSQAPASSAAQSGTPARRLYCASLPSEPGLIELDELARRHAQVLRLTPGTDLRLFNGVGGEASARVVRCDRQVLSAQVESLRHLPPPAARLHLLVGVPKAAKLELIVRMTTELGVHAIGLIQSERAVPRFDAESPKLERLRRISLEACAQSGQTYAPVLAGPLPLEAAVAQLPAAATKFVFWEGVRASASAEAPRELARDTTDVCALVGPEGGLCVDEVNVLAALGFTPIGLGRNILRVETACVVACALLIDRLRALR
jgi:16S rRNA (uracil1498-N3)-methyltransferase